VQGKQEIISQLNQILTKELISINQYFVHARMYDNWGFKKLGKQTLSESIEEMKHADELVQRILFLEGNPNLQDLKKLHIGKDVEQMLRNDLALELDNHPALRQAIARCEKHDDYVSSQLLEKILSNEEEHIDWLEQQLYIIEKIGLPNYLQSQTGD